MRCADIYLHWLLLLGFECLAVTTVSLDEREGDEAAGFLSTVDFVLSDVPLATTTLFERITPDWCRRVFDDPNAAPAVLVPGDGVPLRILRTSGTTGLAKRLYFSRETQTAWLDATHWYTAYTMEARLLMALPFTVESAYTGVTKCLRAGGTVVMAPFNRTGTISALLQRHAITHMLLLPVQLKQLLDELPADFVKPAGVGVTVIGGTVGNELRAASLVRLVDRVLEVYGTNEAGFVSLRRSPEPEGVGIIGPMAEVEVVDEADAPLKEGQAGWIRIKAAGMFGGYLGDPDANRRMLRDGWFYPGDMGILLGNRRLKVLGRGDELLNIGGIKIGPDSLEDRVRSLVPLGDIGACSLRNQAGIGEVYLGVVKRPGQDDAIYSQVLQAVSQLGLGVFFVVKLDRVPRNPNGKIRRKQLKRAIADEILRHDPGLAVARHAGPR